MPSLYSPIQDTVTARRNMTRYTNLDNGFANTREANFATTITETVENSDVQDFTEAVVDFDQEEPLDNLKTAILLKIKNRMDERSLV